MWPEIVNTAGLVSNIVGVAIAFRWGYPQPSYEETVGLALEGDVVPGVKEAAQAQRRKYLLLSRFGLVLMGLGFFLQLGATWIARWL